MNIQHHTHPDQLEKYSFLWSEARLLIAALALFLGGRPPIGVILPGMFGITGPLLNLSWIISGVAAGYLLYRWHGGGRKLFGAREQKDTFAFFVSVISGINLGLMGVFQQNIGMSIAYGNQLLFFVAGVLYLWVAWHLWQRWNASGQKVF